MTAADDESRGRDDDDDGPYAYGVVDRGLLARALTALVAHHAKRRTNDDDDDEATRDLFGDDADVNVQFGLREVPRRPGPKPVRLSLPRPLRRVDDDDDDDDNDLDRASVCLIVKSDETKTWVRELLENEDVAPYHSVKKVLTLDSLRKKHTSHAQRRELCSRFDLFLADDRVLPMLGKALGRTFFDRKKNPVPIRLTRREALPYAVRECLEGTFLYVPRGRCANVRVGSTRAPIDHLVDNVVAVVEGAVERLSGWRNLSSLSVKTCDSASLPFYLMTPDRATTIQRAKQIADKRPREKTTTKDDEDAEKTKKRKTDKSSPLLRALRKAEDVDSTKTKKHDDDDNNEKTKKKKKRSSEPPADQTTETKKTKTKKDVNEAVDEKKEEKVEKRPAKSDETKKRRDNTSTPTKEDDEKKKEEASEETPSASDKKKKKKKKKHDDDDDDDAAETKKSEAKKKNEIVETKTEESSSAKHSSEKKKKKKKKKDDDDAESRTTTTDEEKESSPSFAPSKTFRGSRAGRVFRTGDRGVGYYADEVPVPDPTLSRTRGRRPQQQQKRRRSGGGGGKGRSRSGSRR